MRMDALQDVHVNLAMHGTQEVIVFQNKNASISVLKVNITETVNTAAKKLATSLHSAIEVLPLIHLEMSKMVGSSVLSKAVSVIMEFVSITLMELVPVLIAVKLSTVEKMNSGILAHLHVVMSIVMAMTNVAPASMVRDHVSHVVRVKTDLFEIGIPAFVWSNQRVVWLQHARIILGSVTVEQFVIISINALEMPWRGLSCLTVSQWDVVLCAYVTRDSQ